MEILKKIITNSPDCTRKEAQKMAKKLKPGDIVGLIGDLGSGKTVFTKGLAEGLHIKEIITSPTFAILNIYNGDIDLYHFDIYRLHSREDLENIGYEEYFYGKGITVIEWADKCLDILPEICYLVYLKFLNENQREIKICRK